MAKPKTVHFSNDKTGRYNRWQNKRTPGTACGQSLKDTVTTTDDPNATTCGLCRNSRTVRAYYEVQDRDAKAAARVEWYERIFGAPYMAAIRADRVEDFLGESQWKVFVRRVEITNLAEEYTFAAPDREAALRVLSEEMPKAGAAWHFRHRTLDRRSGQYEAPSAWHGKGQVDIEAYLGKPCLDCYRSDVACTTCNGYGLIDWVRIPVEALDALREKMHPDIAALPDAVIEAIVQVEAIALPEPEDVAVPDPVT